MVTSRWRGVAQLAFTAALGAHAVSGAPQISPLAGINGWYLSFNTAHCQQVRAEDIVVAAYAALLKGGGKLQSRGDARYFDYPIRAILYVSVEGRAVAEEESLYVVSAKVFRVGYLEDRDRSPGARTLVIAHEGATVILTKPEKVRKEVLESVTTHVDRIMTLWNLTREGLPVA